MNVCLRVGDLQLETHNQEARNPLLLQRICCSGAHVPPFPEERQWIRGLPYMTPAVGGGRWVPQKQTKGTKSADL